MSRITNLDHILLQFANPALRERVRQGLRESTRQSSGNPPLTGAYYWVPLPGCRDTLDWRLVTFYDSWGCSTGHVDVWKHIQDLLHWHWQRSVRAVDYASLPRGRVCRSRLRSAAGIQTVFAIYHGNDCPIGRRGLRVVRQAFQLDRDAPAFFDEHEQMIIGQPDHLSGTIKFDLRLKKIETREVRAIARAMPPRIRTGKLNAKISHVFGSRPNPGNTQRFSSLQSKLLQRLDSVVFAG